jgi:pimeloyl-ACP methyl ester carboxylesterase
VAYWVNNPEAQTVIVMIHGFRGNHKGLDYVARDLGDFQLVVPDLPGYGESEPLDTTHTIQHYGQWLDGFVAALGLKQWISWSHSGAGPIAVVQAATGKYPPRGLVTISPALPVSKWSSLGVTLYYWLGEIMPPRLRHAWLTSRRIDHAMGRWLFMTVSTAKRREIQRRAEHDLPRLNAQVITEHYFSSTTARTEEYFRRLTMPVLVLAGARDVIVSLDRLKQLVALIPHAQLEVMEDQGHLSPMERPETVALFTDRFVSKLKR